MAYYIEGAKPTELVHIRGNTYCIREHDSLKIIDLEFSLKKAYSFFNEVNYGT